MRGGLHVSVTDGSGRRVRDAGLGRWLAAVAPGPARGDVAVALVSDRHIRRLNHRYRGKDAPTDVLSFQPEPVHGLPHVSDPAAAIRRLRLRAAPAPAGGGSFVGDIVIAAPVARRQARALGHSYATELRVLALHGLLHLLGYDHDDSEDGGRMARVEARLRRKGGLPQGLIGRSRAGGRGR